MSIESKALATKDMLAWIVSALPDEGAVKARQDAKWVRLEEAQTLKAEKDKIIQDGIKSHSELYEKLVNVQTENKQLKKQVFEANKILDVIIANCQDRYNVDSCEKCCDKNCCEEHELQLTLKSKESSEVNGK